MKNILIVNTVFEVWMLLKSLKRKDFNFTLILFKLSTQAELFKYMLKCVLLGQF